MEKLKCTNQIYIHVGKAKSIIENILIFGSSSRLPFQTLLSRLFDNIYTTTVSHPQQVKIPLVLERLQDSMQKNRESSFLHNCVLYDSGTVPGSDKTSEKTLLFYPRAYLGPFSNSILRNLTGKPAWLGQGSSLILFTATSSSPESHQLAAAAGGKKSKSRRRKKCHQHTIKGEQSNKKFNNCQEKKVGENSP